MAHDPHHLAPEVLAFLAERHLATLTTLRPDGTPHVVAVGFSWDDEAGLVRVITNGTSRKAAHVRAGSPHVVAVGSCGTREPADNPARVVIEIAVDRVLGPS
jgi:predicted pyridoxine 5'-phosphate oxidase superfamily flavin-nucleotide-binding protein